MAIAMATPAMAEHHPWMPPVFAPVPHWLADALSPGKILFCVSITLILAATFVTLVTRFRRKRRIMRHELLELRNGPRFRMIDAMCHAARKANTISKPRLQRALEIARDATGKDYTLEQLNEVALLTDRVIVPTNFFWMRDGLNKGEKMVVFNSTASVLLADGPLTRSERTFLRILTRGLGLTEDDLRHLSSLTRT
ncbi:hypothetical protein [Jannaschia pohangensis]|uniref:Tellurite resistance protein TerB n=1 Tax=Jannaschia pohangensis TaxID=390807 RepID=A0A1I3R124_9RHOB|nr:hypothetical protein [Jannaschia pohangensis]SFJ40038.1 hypothetical protein SAMN04488095_2748 [Jannaschia pohangensis]